MFSLYLHQCKYLINSSSWNILQAGLKTLKNITMTIFMCCNLTVWYEQEKSYTHPKHELGFHAHCKTISEPTYSADRYDILQGKP